MIGTAVKSLFFSIFAFMVLGALFLDIFKDDPIVKVPYHMGTRICQGGYDFRTPRCKYMLLDEQRAKRHEIKLGIVNDDTKQFLGYAGWLVPRNEIEQVLDQMYMAYGSEYEWEARVNMPMPVNAWVGNLSTQVGYGPIKKVKRFDDIDIESLQRAMKGGICRYGYYVADLLYGEYRRMRPYWGNIEGRKYNQEGCEDRPDYTEADIQEMERQVEEFHAEWRKQKELEGK